MTTDKRFLLLEDGTWDLRSRHNSSKVVKVNLEDEEEDDIEETVLEESEEEDTNYDSRVSDDDDDTFDDTEDDLKDLVVLDEDELELEQ